MTFKIILRKAVATMEIQILAKIKGDAGTYRVRSLDGEGLRMLVERNCGSEWVNNDKIQFIEIVQEKNGEATATMDNVKCSFRQIETLVIPHDYKVAVKKIEPKAEMTWHNGCYFTINIRQKEIGFGVTESIAWENAYKKY